MNRSSWILSLLVVLALGWAFAVSRSMDAPTGGDALLTVWKVPAGDISRIVYSAGQLQAVVQPLPSGTGRSPYLWITAKGLPAPGGGKTQADAAEAFKGNSLAAQALTDLAHLQATRSLGPAAKIKLADYGLVGSTVSLTVEAKDALPLKVDLGMQALGGTSRYAIFNGVVYTLRQPQLAPLETARLLMDRDLFSFPVQRAERIELRSGGRQRTLYALHGASPVQAGWASSAKAQAGDPAQLQWVIDLARTKVQEYAAGDPALPDPDPAALDVKVFPTDNAPAATLRLAGPQAGRYLARSSHTTRSVYLVPELAKPLLEQARLLVAKP
jgi:hypothetical protein